MAKVVHVYQSGMSYDVYIGRGLDPKTYTIGEWGNDWSHKEGTLAKYKTKTAQEAVEKHRDWVLGQPGLVAKIRRELKGKVLGCWCRTKRNPNGPCHGDILAEVADSDSDYLKKKYGTVKIVDRRSTNWVWTGEV